MQLAANSTLLNSVKQIKSDSCNGFDTVSQWIYQNYMILNVAKCRFIHLGKNTENETF